MATLNLREFTQEEALELLYSGLEARRQGILAKIEDLHLQLGDRRTLRARNNRGIDPPAPRARKFSKEARQRIIDGQKRRRSLPCLAASGGNWASALRAPRSLKLPVRWRNSCLHQI